MERLEKYYNQIKNSPVFHGMNDNELRGLLECFNARVRKYEKEEMIIRQGDIISNIYLIIDGEVNIEKDSYWGRRIIISRLEKNDNLALSFVGSKDVESSIDAVAIKDTNNKIVCIFIFFSLFIEYFYLAFLVLFFLQLLYHQNVAFYFFLLLDKSHVLFQLL